MKSKKQVKDRFENKEYLYILKEVISKCKDKEEAYWKGYRAGLDWVLEE